MLIYLIGYMYSGKTTVGHALAERLGWRFCDLDQLIEERFRTTVPIFFQRYGEQMFREVERQMLRSTASMDNAVISTGGGTPCFFDNIDFINAHGTSVYLSLTPQAIGRRMVVSRKCRPTIKALPEDERQRYIEEQIAMRRPTYLKAHHTIDCDDLPTAAIVDLVVEKLSNR